MGPFSHLAVAKKAWPVAAKAHSLNVEQNRPAPGLKSAFFAGALAPDAGYYADGLGPLSDLAHVVNPWEFTKTLWESAKTPKERAFALGWLSHALVDVEGHSRLVNPAMGGGLSLSPLKHKQIEWGLDCLVLMQDEYAWLWSVEIDRAAGLELWQRAMSKVYGKAVEKKLLQTAMAAEIKEVGRLPYVWWLSGRLKRRGRWGGNALGSVVGGTLRPVYVKYLEWRDIEMNIRAVLTPIPPGSREIGTWKDILGEIPAKIAAWPVHGDSPRMNLDADPACPPGKCPTGQKALSWLAGQAPGKIN